MSGAKHTTSKSTKNRKLFGRLSANISASQSREPTAASAPRSDAGAKRRTIALISSLKIESNSPQRRRARNIALLRHSHFTNAPYEKGKAAGEGNLSRAASSSLVASSCGHHPGNKTPLCPLLVRGRKMENFILRSGTSGA